MDEDYIKALHALPDYQQIQALWIEVGYAGDKLAQKEADVVSEVRGMVSNLLSREKSNQAKMLGQKTELEKQIAQLKTKLKLRTEGLPSPRPSTLAQNLESLSKQHAALLQVFDFF